MFNLLVSCRKDVSISPVNNFNNNKILAIGHGGSGTHYIYPMNSLESIKHCADLGADGIEMDIQMTADSVLFTFHDFYLDKKTNCTNTVLSHNASELNNCFYNDFAPKKVKLRKLEEIFGGLNDVNSRYYVFDCKLYTEAVSDEYVARFSRSLHAFIVEHHLENNVFIESVDVTFLQKLQKLNSNLMLFVYPQTFQDGYEKVLKYNFYGITMSTHTISKEQIALMHSLGKRVAIWNLLRKSDNVEGIAKSPDYMQTDYVKHLKNLNRE